MYNFYSGLKARKKEHLREHSLVNTLGEMLVSTYDLKVDQTEINPRYFLEKLLTNGVLGVVRIGDLLYFGHCAFSEVNPNDGIGKNVTVYIVGDTVNGSYYFEDWRNNENVAIVRLNSFCEPDLNIFRYGYMLSQIDNSMLCNVINTRLTNIFRAKDNRSKERLNEAIRSSYIGDPSIIVDELMISDDVGNAFDYMELNPSDKISNIQYLSVTRSYIMDTFFSLYGMRSVGGEKIAQQTVSEINQGTNASWILVKNRLATIRDDLEELNRKFGSNWTIDFSECWKDEDKLDDPETMDQDGDPDQDEDQNGEEEMPNDDDQGTMGEGDQVDD